MLAGIWNATTPLIVLPLAVLVFRTERLTVRRAVGLGLGFVGVLVVLGVWRGHRRGALHRAAHVLRRGGLLRRRHPVPEAVRRRPPDSGRVARRGAALLAAAAAGRRRAARGRRAAGCPTDLSAEVVASVLALGALGTGLAFVLNLRIIRVAGATTASTVTYLSRSSRC